jgi:predicted nuclease with TOPRIM domain
MVEEEFRTSEQELSRLNTKLQEAETEKLKALERERAMNAELEKEVDAEPEKINSIEAMKRRLEEERRGLRHATCCHMPARPSAFATFDLLMCAATCFVPALRD